MLSLVGLAAEDWSAIAAMGTMLVAIAAGILALGQLREARKLRAEQTQPYVVAYLAQSEASPVVYDLAIKNFGQTVARDVTVTITPEAKRASHPEERVEVPALSILVPGQEWRTLWDTTIARYESGLPDEYVASVTFSDSHGKERFAFSFDLDWKIVRRGYAEVYGVHDIAKTLRDVQKTLKEWHRAGDSGLTVMVRDGDASDARRLARHEERRARESEPPVPPVSADGTED